MKKSLENLFLLDIEGLELLAADLGIDPHVFKTTPLFSATRELNPEVETSDEKVYLESMKNTSPSLKELDIQGDDPEEGNFLNRNINSQALEESDKINTIEGPKHKVRPKLKDKISQNNELEFVKNNRQDKINAKNNIPSQKSENIFKNQSQSKKDNRINLYSIGDDPQAVSSYENVLNSNYSKKPSVPSQKYDVDGLKTLHSPIINFKVETSPQVFNKPKKPVSEDNFEGLKLTSNVSDTREQGNPKFVKNEQHDNVKKGIRLDAAIKSPYDGLQPRIVLKFTISRTGH
ncbi:hypothetical protein NBO_9g0012 [Nosema bombycis CQ1]|uniref:Uncharacterized protein n=1 Tax=Nosema bombycis (strain CQ1 / CVCC 102059) TaxID=578461 RepID=R0MLL1_NOSB1|nr:hypothetical protein NBO_9g0012 [Nosema bombycis CQ1]|eukprot:EOB15135.1 hypothetical protein NBO_9g0012 [Nosema bombycis CQ1]